VFYETACAFKRGVHNYHGLLLLLVVGGLAVNCVVGRFKGTHISGKHLLYEPTRACTPFSILLLSGSPSATWSSSRSRYLRNSLVRDLPPGLPLTPFGSTAGLCDPTLPGNPTWLRRCAVAYACLIRLDSCIHAVALLDQCRQCGTESSLIAILAQTRIVMCSLIGKAAGVDHINERSNVSLQFAVAQSGRTTFKLRVPVRVKRQVLYIGICENVGSWTTGLTAVHSDDAIGSAARFNISDIISDPLLNPWTVQDARRTTRPSENC